MSEGRGPGRPRLKVGSTSSARWSRRPRKKTTPLEQLKLKPLEPPDSLRSAMAAHLEAMAVVNSSTASLMSKARDLRLFAEWCEARSLNRAADVTRPILERYQRHLYYFRKPSGAPLSVERQLSLLSQLKGFFRWATRQNLLLANPAADLVLPKKPSRLPRFTPSVSEVEKVLQGCDVTELIGLRDRAVLELLWATGLRRTEVINLSVWDVQWEKGTVFVRQGKGHKDRVVPISARALSWLRRYVDEVRPRYALPADEGRLFLSDSGLPFLPSMMTQMVRKRILAAGVEAKGAACHVFRHACATQMLEAGADIRFVQELLGHANLNTTQIYTRVSIAKLKAVYEATHPGAKPAAAADSPPPEGVRTPAELLAELEYEAATELDTGDGE